MRISQYNRFSEAQTERIVEVLKGIAHPLRFRIVVFLCQKGRTVTEMTEFLDARQSLVSQHLAQLRLIGLVEVNRDGPRQEYTLKEAMLGDLIHCLKGCKAR